MNSSAKGKNILVIWSVALVVFALSGLATGGDNKQPSHSSAPSHPAPASHAAPASRPTGNTGQRPGGTPTGNQMGNRGPGGSSQVGNRGPGGATNNTNRGPSNQMGNRGPGGANTNVNRGQTNQTGNRGNVNNTNNRGNMGNNRTPVNANANRRQPTGSRTVTLRNGGNATFRQNGQVRSIQTHGMTINRGLNGRRNIVASRNGRTVVAYGHAGGYSQRAYFRRGNTVYVQRTYVYGGRTYAYAYRSYYWGGRPYYGYAPAYYWGPAYYGWAYNPWPAPVYYGWGWAGQPWYGYYGPYWAPYPVYPSAAFWLTDFFLAASLRAAYEAGQQSPEQGELTPPQFQQEASDVVASLYSSDPLVAASLASAYGSNAYLIGAASQAAASGGNGAAMSKEARDAIADEIKNQIAAEQSAATNKDSSSGGNQGAPAALDPKIRYFVVASEEDLTTSDGTECSLTGGDVVYRTGDNPDNDNMVDATVKSAKKGECLVGATVGVAVDDLQDMYNNLRQNMSQGMKEMADNSGKNGLPTAPDTKTTAGEVPAPTPDTNVQSDLQQTQKDADQAEAEAKQQPN
jgi:hypothetical protein